MGKNLVQQARGKGGPRYIARSFHFKGKVCRKKGRARVLEIIRCRAHSAPLAKVEYDDNTIPLVQIPIGMNIHNIESHPGDGGKFVRGSGLAAHILTKTETSIIVVMPSKQRKEFNPYCMATIGTVAGGGRTEKPFLKAGKKFHKMRQKNRLYPVTSGHSQNAVDHPLGNKRSARKAKRRPVGRGTPPGRKVGSLYARRTGRKRGKQ
jgi:large subunit ribosomal protein L2